MKLHEHQAKEILKKYLIPVPEGEVAYSPGEAEQIAKRLGGKVVVKAQIHAGGRGKGGGIKLANDSSEARKHAESLLGKKLKTPQTPGDGRIVSRLLIEKGCDIDQELYLAILLDRAQGRNMIMASRAGGMDIEEVAAKNPEKILKSFIDPLTGFQSFQGRRLAFSLGLEKTDAELPTKFVRFLNLLYGAYLACDASLIEINPLVITREKEILALDAKIQLDDNALFRHADLAKMRDPAEETAGEIKAAEFGLNYIELNGSIGCMVNGAGLAMATMDIIKLHGGEPANFLDVGGGANQEQVREAFRLLVSDPKVKAILVNIFGGIMRCDVIAEGILDAAKELHIKVPLVVRLQGTNVEEGRKLLKNSSLNIIAADTLADAAKKVVSSLSLGGK